MGLHCISFMIKHFRLATLTLAATWMLAALLAIAPAYATSLVVVVDAGHGGTAPAGTMAERTLSSPNNATSPGKKFKEKDLTLDLAGRTIRALNALPKQGAFNVKAVPTRTTDVNLNMAERAKITRDAGAVIFVSIHFNAANGKVLGSRGVIRAKTYSKSYGTDHAYAMALADCTNKVLRTYLPGGTARVQDDSELHGGKGSNLFHQFGLSKKTETMPACFLEVEFLDVPDFEALLVNKKDELFDKLAAALALELRAQAIATSGTKR
ncbi:hypothetical protein DB346_01090 [Verrucomicrobia bacterium LW23]|nr:hypothetical protein DB346_01090 [Verrucomicrobia bacterium LW23]